MYYALVYYPRIQDREFHQFRNRYEPFADLIAEHVPFIFPLPGTFGREKLEFHIEAVLSSWNPFRVRFSRLELSWDHWLMLTTEEGDEDANKLHDHLYTGQLEPFLCEDLPFRPHIGLGLFSKEQYDFEHPEAKLELDEEKYNTARKEFEELEFDFWCTIDQLMLVEVNESFTKSRDLRSFDL